MIGLASALNFVVTANGLPAGLHAPWRNPSPNMPSLSLSTVLGDDVAGLRLRHTTIALPSRAACRCRGPCHQCRRGWPITTCLVIGLISFVLLGPLYYFWFRALGWVG